MKDLRRPDRHTAMKVLVDKSFGFVDNLWETYVSQNKSNLRCVICYSMQICGLDKVLISYFFIIALLVTMMN